MQVGRSFHKCRADACHSVCLKDAAMMVLDLVVRSMLLSLSMLGSYCYVGWAIKFTKAG